MAVQAAQLVVSLTAQGAQQTEGAINRVSGAVDKAAGGFDAFFESIKGGAGSALRALDGISKAMGAIAVMGGITLLAGGAKAAWNQVDAVQQATIALRAYETDARKVDKVLEDLLAFARSDQGKLFMRQELFHAAQAMKVAGAETENLAEYVEILSRSVSSGMGNWAELERVITRVGTTGRLAAEDWEMLTKMGYQIDPMLKGQAISWEELFDVLDRGSFIIEGQTETIQGRLMSLQTAIRGIGLAFLDVDSETSMFREGGLGDRIMSGLEHAPALLASVADAAGQLGNAIVGVIDFVTNMVRAFQMLPGPVQSAATALLKIVTAFGALRVAGRAMGMIGAMTGLGGLGGLLGGGGAAGGARGLSTAIGGLIGRINPLGLAISGVIALGTSWVNSFMQQKQAVEDYGASVTTLTATLESLRRQGLRDRATQGEGLAGIIDNIDERSLEMMERWGEGYENFDADELKRYTEFQEVSIAQQEQLNSLLNEALLDPNVDVDAWMSWVTTLLTGAENAEELKANVDLVIATPLSDFALEGADSMDTLGESMEKVGATAAEVSEIFADLPSRLDDLRIDGLSRQAADIEHLGTAMEKAFQPIKEYEQDRYGQDTGVFTIIDELDATKLETLAGSWERISDALASGDFDNARLMADVMEVLADPSLSMDQKADEIDNIANSLVNYRNIAADVLELTGKGSLTSMLDLAGLGDEAVSAAANVNELSASMDTLFRVVVGNTDAIGQQSQALADWADELIGVQGEYSKLDDLVKAGRITGTSGVFDDGSEYAMAQQAYNDILEANAEIQEHILVIQAKQAPLLAANADAMADYMGAIADMPVGEQLAALGFMDEGLQSQLGTVIDLAAQMKNLEGGEDTFRQMAEGIAMTNPALFAMMENVGLVTDVVRNADGTVASFEINLDGADSVQESLNSLIESIDALTVALGGVAPAAEAAMSALSSMGGTARDAMLAALPDRGAATHGDTGVPVVTGLPNTGTGGTMTIDADTSAAHTVISLLEDRLNALEARTFITYIDADTSSAHNVLSLFEDRVNELESRTFMTTIDADSSSAHNVLSLLEDRLDGYAGNVYTAVLDANSSSAHNVLTLLQNRLDAFNGSVYTATMNVNVSSTRIPGRATGGFVDEPLTLVGERGPELVSLPQGSYVHTNAESVRMMSGSAGKGGNNDNSITVNLNGATFHNTSREEMNAWAENDLIPGITRAVADRRTGMGA